MTIHELINAMRLVLRSTDPVEESDAALIKHCLLKNVSYRLPESAKSDRLIGFRMWSRLRNRMRGPKPVFTQTDGNPHILLVNANQNKAQSILTYIAHESGEKPGFCLGKEELPIAGFELDSKDRRKLFRFGLWIAWQCFWRKDRQNRSLLPLAVMEAHQLLHFVKEHDVKYVYDFAPYLIDANWFTHLLTHHGVQVTRIPSSGPIKTHNRFTLGTTMVLSTPYQKEEAEIFSSTLRVNTFTKWIPEHALNYLDLYLSSPPTPAAKSIGFYSHAAWVRQTEGHTDDALRIPEAEVQILKDLKGFLKSNPEYTLTIFLHPRERRPDLADATKAFYSELLQGIPYRFSPVELSSAKSFHTVDIGVAAFSTILYERLFCGYKTLIGNYFMEDFPLKGSSLEGVCFSSDESMRTLLKEAGRIGTEQFFQNYRLTGFRFDAFPSVQRRLQSP